MENWSKGNKYTEEIKEKLNDFSNWIWKVANNWILRYLIFISVWILSVKTLYQYMWMLVVYDITTVYKVFWYWLLVWIGLSIVWNTLINVLNNIITKYSAK